MDREPVRAVVCAAFAQNEEADLVDALYAEGAVLASLVGLADGRCAGHILFSRMWIDQASGESIPVVSLAPLAVAPEFQNQGIGSVLTRAGIEACASLGERVMLVLGHRDYYPRFGFSAGLARALEHPFDADHFMALELVPGALDGVRGKVRYAKAFGI